MQGVHGLLTSEGRRGRTAEEGVTKGEVIFQARGGSLTPWLGLRR